jgi:hypothetical protein
MRQTLNYCSLVMLPEMGNEPETDACQPMCCDTVNMSAPDILDSDVFVHG